MAFRLLNPEKISIRDVYLTTNVFASSNTTAIALRTVFYHLLQSPRKMQKPVAETDNADTRGDNSQPISFHKSTISLPYLQVVIKEALRIHSSVGLLLEDLSRPAAQTYVGDLFQERRLCLFGLICSRVQTRLHKANVPCLPPLACLSSTPQNVAESQDQA